MPATDAQRHEAFIVYARQIADLSMPWLFPLLDECEAHVLAGPGVFRFSVPSKPQEWFSLDDFAKQLAVVPWATPEDTAH